MILFYSFLEIADFWRKFTQTVAVKIRCHYSDLSFKGNSSNRIHSLWMRQRLS